MIIKGGSCSDAGRIAAHLLRTDQNERTELVEMRGVIGRSLPDALREMETAALCGQTLKPFYHASINPRAHEQMTPAQWAEAVDRLEAGLGLTGQPRAVIEHVKDGRTHRHVVWSRVDLATGRSISDSHNYRKHEECARALEGAFGFERVQGAHVERGRRPRPGRTPGHDDMQQAARTGIDPRAATRLITGLWQGTTNGEGFKAALEVEGWTLCRGDRRDFVLLDPMGGLHSLARRIIEGANAAQVRERVAGIDRDALPSVKEARAALRQRQARQLLTFPPEVTRHARQRRAARDRPPPRAGNPPGFYVVVSRQRPDYGRAFVPASANGNMPPRPSPIRIKNMGMFRAVSRLIMAPVVSQRPEVFVQAVRPNVRHEQSAGEEIGAGGGDDGGLGALLAAIAAEVNGRTAGIAAGISAEYAGKIRSARKTLPPDQAAGVVAVLRQMKAAAIKAVRESAAMEIKGRQKLARVMWGRKTTTGVSRDRTGPEMV